MEEENFEKKSSKKGLKITLLVVLVLAIIAAVVYFAFFFNKPEAKADEAVNDVVGQMFEETEKTREKMKDVKSAKMEIEVSGGINTSKSADSQLAAQMALVSEILKSAKLNANVAYDLDKKILDSEISVKYQGTDVITAEAIFQDGKLYGYLKDLYSKYIELPIDELDIDVSEFENLLKAAETNENMVKDIEEIIKAKISNSDIKTEETEISIAGKDTKVNKSTLKLSVKEIEDVLNEILGKVNEYQTEAEVKNMITELQEEMKNGVETENYANIEMYTEKSANELVKLDVALVNVESEEVIVVNAQKEDKTWKISFGMNEDSTNTADATTLMEIEVTEENENEGKISITVIAEGIEVTLNVKYKVELNANVSKKNISNSIKAEEMTDADTQEILENIEKNEILKSIVEAAMQTSSY